MNNWELFKVFLTTKANIWDAALAFIGGAVWASFDAIIAELTAISALILLIIRIWIGIKEVRAMKKGERRQRDGKPEDRS